MPVEEDDGAGGKRRTSRARRDRKGTSQGSPMTPRTQKATLHLIARFRVFGTYRGLIFIAESDIGRTDMPRVSRLQKTDRMNAALAFLAEECETSEAVARLSERFGMSQRQAYRYVHISRTMSGPVTAGERSVPVTLKPLRAFPKSRDTVRDERTA